MLMKRMGVDLDNVVKTICVLQITFCVIHNICQKMEDLYINDNEVLENVLTRRPRTATVCFLYSNR